MYRQKKLQKEQSVLKRTSKSNRKQTAVVAVCFLSKLNRKQYETFFVSQPKVRIKINISFSKEKASVPIPQFYF